MQALGRVRLATWKQIAGAFMWLGALSAGSTATAIAVTHKVDAATYADNRQADRDLLAAKLDALDRRLARIEALETKQLEAKTEAAAIAAALRKETR